MLGLIILPVASAIVVDGKRDVPLRVRPDKRKVAGDVDKRRSFDELSYVRDYLAVRKYSWTDGGVLPVQWSRPDRESANNYQERQGIEPHRCSVFLGNPKPRNYNSY